MNLISLKKVNHKLASHLYIVFTTTQQRTVFLMMLWLCVKIHGHLYNDDFQDGKPRNILLHSVYLNMWHPRYGLKPRACILSCGNGGSMWSITLRLETRRQLSLVLFKGFKKSSLTNYDLICLILTKTKMWKWQIVVLWGVMCTNFLN